MKTKMVAIALACVLSSGCLLKIEQKPQSVSEATESLIEALENAWADILDDSGL